MRGHLFFDAVKGSFRTRKLLKVVSRQTKVENQFARKLADAQTVRFFNDSLRLNLM